MVQRKTLKHRNVNPMLIIRLNGNAALNHLGLRDAFPRKTDSEIYAWIAEHAGSPQKRVLDIIEAITTTWADDLGERCHATLAVALREARRLARDPNEKTVQIALSFDSPHEVKA